MRGKMSRTLMVILVVGLILGAATSAQAARKEVAVGRFEAALFDSVLSANVWIAGTGNISPGRDLMVYTSKPDAQPGDDEAAVLAFISLAQSLGCTVGNIQPGGMVGPEGFHVSFVYEGFRSDVIPVIGELMKFTLTLPIAK